MGPERPLNGIKNGYKMEKNRQKAELIETYFTQERGIALGKIKTLLPIVGTAVEALDMAKGLFTDDQIRITEHDIQLIEEAYTTLGLVLDETTRQLKILKGEDGWE